MANDNFMNALSIILKHEGGYVNNPLDKGGETNMGISAKAFPYLDIKNLTFQDVADIYLQSYWKPSQCQYFAYPVALVVFDAAVNSGVTKASKWLQKAANAIAVKRGLSPIIVDGFIGPRTIKLINSLDHGDIILEFTAQRTAFLRVLPNYNTFGKGWSKRVQHTYDEAMRHVDEGADILS